MKYIRKTSNNITSNFLVELLKDRGILPESKEDQAKFYHPTFDSLIDPLKLDNMNEAYELLMKHLQAGSKIFLCIDSDVDGYTSSAFFYNYLTDYLSKDFDFTIDYHVPEGKEHGLRTLMNIFTPEKKWDLIVLPDSSSNDYEEHKELADMGYDILVLDHHEADHYSEFATVVNNQLSQNYENKALSGVGVVYKFFSYMDYCRDTDYAREYIDLVALGEISDMMNMETLENRFICDYGLDNITNKFFKDLVEKQSYSLGSGPLTQIGVAFYITPLINSLIRVGSDLEKERLFEAFIKPETKVPSTKRGEKGMEETISVQAVRNCVNAKARQNRERDKAIDLLDIQILNNDLNKNKILILNADDLDIPYTLTGLCAMGVSAGYKKPVMLGRIGKDGYLRGSIRGRGESELKDFRKFLLDSGLMEFVEGHGNAAGFGIKATDVEKLTEYANEKLANINFNEGFYEADFVVKGNSSYLSELIEDLDAGKKFWGQSNDEPVIVVEDITLPPNGYSIIGKNSDTLRFEFNGVTYVKFKATELIEELSRTSGKLSITAAGKGNINEWGGRRSPQVLVEEIEIKESNSYDF